MPQYHNVRNIAEAELAGCLDVVGDFHNADVVRENLTMRLALYTRRAKAFAIHDELTEEAQTVAVPEYEYVINELQYEFRLAKGTLHNDYDPDNETRLINMWVKHIIRKKDVDTALEFVTILKANRIKRKREVKD
jgi:hypothetical protein